MSETNSNPSPIDSPVPSPAEAGATTAAEPTTSAADAAAPQAKKKRKRKRRRKSAQSTVEGASANGESTVNSDATTNGEPTTAPAEPAGAPPRGQKSTTHAPKGGRKDNAQRGHKRRPEGPHKHRRDNERALRTQEQLASWRWTPTGAQLGYFPPVVPRTTPASEVAVPAEQVAAPETSPQTSAPEPTVIDATAGDAPTPEATVPAMDSPAVDSAAVDSPAVDGPADETDPSDGVEASAPTPDESAAQDGSVAEAALVGSNPAEPAATSASHENARSRDAAAPPRWSIPTDAELASWLSSALTRCPEAERASLLVSLCSHRSFRQRAGQLDQAELRPLIAVYDAVFLDAAPSVAVLDPSSEQPTANNDGIDAREELRRGLEAVSHGSVDILRSWPLPARERLSELAESFELDGAIQRDAARLFFDAPKLVGRLGLRAVCDALSQGRDAAAKDLIKTLGSQPGVPGLLPMLTEALDGQRFGSLVILSYGGAQSRGPDPKAPKRHAGFCLESQRDVWIRTGEGSDAAAFEHYSQVHRRALLPGVVGLYSFGVTRSRKPYAAVLRKGISLQRKLGHGWGLPRTSAVGLATELTLLASGLCRAGVRLSDLDPRRFEVDDEGRVWLSDLWGAELVEARPQDAKAVSVCRETVVQLLANQPSFTLPDDWREVLSHSADFETIVATLRKLEKSRFWRS